MKLLLLILGAAGVWTLGMLGLFRVFLSSVSDMGNNTGALAAPLVGVVYGFIYGVVLAFLVALLLGLFVAALNELGFFAPWSRLRVRVWALTTSLVTLGAIVAGYKFFPGVRSGIKGLFNLALSFLT
jgi:tetrahydromethanopterin S-methyltransferase subunit C